KTSSNRAHGLASDAWRTVRAVIPARDDELSALAWSFLFAFTALGGNYILRPLRDEMGVAAGPKHLPSLFLTTLVAMLAINPLFTMLVLFCPRRRLVPVLFRVLALSLVAFYLLLVTAPEPQFSMVARAFFVWASLVNLLVVSVIWGFLSDRFQTE